MPTYLGALILGVPVWILLYYNRRRDLRHTGDTKKAVETLEQTIKLKPDYRDAYYALGLYYHDLAADEKGKVINQALQEKAEQTMQYILDNFSKEDTQAKQALETWGATIK